MLRIAFHASSCVAGSRTVPRASRRGLAVWLAAPIGSLLAQPLSAQQGLERWLENVLPRTVGTTIDDEVFERGATASMDPAIGTEVSTALEARHVGLGPHSLRWEEVSARLRQPLFARLVTLDIAASHHIESRLEMDEGRLRLDAPTGIMAGVTGRLETGPARWALRLGGGWRGGRGWDLSLAGASAFHRLTARRWITRQGGLRLTLPSADVEGTSRTSSEGSAALLQIRWPSGRLGGTGVTAEWRRESFDPLAENGRTELGARIAGVREETEVGVRVRLLPSAVLEVALRRTRADADGSVAQNDQRAGRLFFGRLDSDRWEVVLADPGDDSRWRGRLSRGHSEGSLSARLETWPFRDVWDQLGALAYRVRGDVVTRWTALSFDRNPGGTEGWSLGIQHLRIRLDGEDWLVSGLGFGRSDERSLEDVRATTLLAGGELRLALPGFTDHAVGLLGASVPIHASGNQALEEGLAGSGWTGEWSRWANVTVGLSWSLSSW